MTDAAEISFFLELERAAKSLTVAGGKKNADELRRMFEDLQSSDIFVEIPVGRQTLPKR